MLIVPSNFNDLPSLKKPDLFSQGIPGIFETAAEVLVSTSDTMQSPSGSLLGMSLPFFGTLRDFCNTSQKSTVTQFTHLGCPTTAYCNCRIKFTFCKGKMREMSIKQVHLGSSKARI